MERSLCGERDGYCGVEDDFSECECDELEEWSNLCHCEKNYAFSMMNKLVEGPMLFSKEF
jgi:hypothetical protein